MTRVVVKLLCGWCALLLAAPGLAADPRLWRFPVRELTRQNLTLSLGRGADDVYVWDCKPGMAGPVSVSASTQHTVAPAGEYEVVVRARPADIQRRQPALQLLVREEGVGPIADVVLYSSDFTRDDEFTDWNARLAKTLDTSSLTWSLRYLGGAVQVDEVQLLPVHRQGDNWPEVEISQLGPTRLISETAHPVEVLAAVKNHTFHRQNVELSLWAEGGVHDLLWRQHRPLELEPLESKCVRFIHQPAGVPGGFSVRAELTRDGQPLDARSEVFAVADNFNAVSQLGAAALDVEPLQAGALAIGYRTAGIAALEENFWAPCDFSRMAPAEDQWISGQGLRRVDKQQLQHAVAAVRAQGLRLLTYGDMWLCGPAGFDWARRHPEQAIWDKYWYGGTYDVGQLDALRGGELPLARKIGGWAALTPRLSDPAVARLEADQIIASARMFGWDGIRYDNDGLLAITGRDVLGRERATDPPEDAAEASARVIRQLRGTVAKSLPQFVFGDNIGGRHAGRPPDAKWRAEAANGGMIFEEGIGQQSAKGTWAELARHAVLTARTARACGGYQVNLVTTLLPQLCWSARRYAYVLELAAGAHVAYAAPEHAMRRYCLFALRYGELLYDLSAQSLEADANPFSTTASVWSKDYANRRELPNGTIQYIQSLVQPPPAERVADAFPPVQTMRDVPLRFRVPAGEQFANAWALEPDEFPGAQRLPAEPAGELQLIVPRLKYWTVVVVETRRHGTGNRNAAK